jgi:hypothetical protein
MGSAGVRRRKGGSGGAMQFGSRCTGIRCGSGAKGSRGGGKSEIGRGTECGRPSLSGTACVSYATRYFREHPHVVPVDRNDTAVASGRCGFERAGDRTAYDEGRRHDQGMVASALIVPFSVSLRIRFDQTQGEKNCI